MGISREREGLSSSLTPPSGYHETRYPGTFDDETSNVTEELLEARLRVRSEQNGSVPTKKPLTRIIEVEGLDDQQFMEVIETLRTPRR